MRTLPLCGKYVAAQRWPAALEAAALLRALGAQESPAPARVALTLDDVDVDESPSDTAQDWAATGLADLTGRPGGPPLLPRGAPATMARALGLAIRSLGGTVEDGAGLLGMRTTFLPLTRGGERSANGTSRLLRTRDGWLALSLARSADLDLVAALVQHPAGADPWQDVAAWAATVDARAAVERAAMIGLAASRLGEQTTTAPWELTPWPSESRRQEWPPRVVNLGALWAAPLAAHVLHESGARVLDVRTGRGEDPGGAWRRRLGHQHLTEHVDLTTERGRTRFRQIVTDADVVIEASRPRALRQLGVDAESIQPDGRPRVWLRITGHQRPAERIAYGDDAAVAGGLVAQDSHGPVFAGDAMADPLTGLSAALVGLACLREGGSWVGDITMSAAAARAANTPFDGQSV